MRNLAAALSISRFAALPARRPRRYHHPVITFGEVMIGVMAGCVLILFGLFPPPFERLMEELSNFTDSLSSRFRRQPRRYEQIQKPVWWLAGLGMALIAVTVLAYLSPT
jgi:drug/metabolite transporter (DMT)-like permease